MTKVDLPYIKSYRDRAGIWRHYFRRQKRNYGALPGKPGSSEFMDAYAAFLESKPEPSGKALGTFGRVITNYYASVNFINLKPSSKRNYRYVLEPLAKEHGHKPVTLLTDGEVRDIIEDIGKRSPQMANLTKRVLRNVLIIAYDRGWISRPVTGGKIVPYKGGKHRAWTQDELDIYEARWPIGTRERLAYAALLYTDQRGGDVVRMLRSDVVKGAIPVIQEKTDVVVGLPIHAELLAAIKACPSNGLTILGDRHGRRISRAALTEIIKKARELAGLPPGCKPHGLRKSMLVRMSHNGASTKEMQSISGHRTTKEIERYSEDANRQVLAFSALSKMSKKGTPSV
jgi:Phage integrase family